MKHNPDFRPRIDRTTTKYFEILAGNIRKSIEKACLTGENPRDETSRLLKTIMGFSILSSMKIEPEAMVKALEDVPRRILIAAERRLIAKKRTYILDIILKAIRLKLDRERD